MSLSPIVGVTTCDPAFEPLAIEAARRFRRFTGCDCIIITSEKAGFDLMLEAVRVAHGRVMCLFDADWWMICDTPMTEFIGMSGLAAVHDPSTMHNTFCRNDADVFGIPRERYVNTGLVIANTADSRVIRSFDRASVILAEKAAGMHPLIRDKTEQSCLNAALHENCLPSRFLPPEWNTYLYAAHYERIDSIPARPIAMHAAGIPAERKMEWLKLQTQAWGFFNA